MAAGRGLVNSRRDPFLLEEGTSPTMPSLDVGEGFLVRGAEPENTVREDLIADLGHSDPALDLSEASVIRLASSMQNSQSHRKNYKGMTRP